MGYKVTVDEIENVSHNSGLPTLNDNLEELADEFDNVLYRDGSMAVTGDIDMDSNRVLNLPAPGSANEPVRLIDITGPLPEYDVTAALEDALAVSNGGSLIGFTQDGVGAVDSDAHTKLKEVVSVKDFGAVGDGVADDYAAIVLARTRAILIGGALHFPQGTYAYGTRLELGFSNLHITCAGRVTFKPTYAGPAISFDAGVAPGLVYGVHFGWGNPPTIQGNILTTDAVYIRSSHHMKLDVRIRDCVTGVRVLFSVLSEFKINHSSNQGGWTILNPTNGLIVDRRETAEATTACRFDICIEGVTGMGVDLACAQHCDFWGTSEGNGAGGINLQVDSINNNFYNVFCENNGTAPHWTIGSGNNIFFNCTGGGAANTGTNTNTITGTRNYFIRGKWHNLTSGGFYNEFSQVALSGAYTSNPNDIREKCHDGAGTELSDNYSLPAITAPTLAGLWVAQTANGERAPGYYKDRAGIVHLVGAVKSGAPSSIIFTLPSGFRPEGTIYLPYDNVTAGTVGRIAISENGEVQHLSGDTGTVSLATISFPAEN